MADVLAAQQTAERWVARVRAEQHALSRPLIVVGFSVLVEGALQFHPLWNSAPASIDVYRQSWVAAVLLPLATFAALWIGMRVSRARSGLGSGRPG